MQIKSKLRVIRLNDLEPREFTELNISRHNSAAQYNKWVCIKLGAYEATVDAQELNHALQCILKAPAP